MPLYRVALLSFIAVITMVNPLAVVPSFIALTDGTSRRARARIAFLAGLSCVAVLIVFLLAGNYIFQFYVRVAKFLFNPLLFGKGSLYIENQHQYDDQEY